MKDSQIIYKILRRRDKYKHLREDKPFDSSSIADMAFLLLIYFIVTSSFILREGVFLSLPSKNAGAVHLEENKIVEVYPENNGFLFDGKLIDRDKFKIILSEKKSKVPEAILMIKMMPDVKYQRLVDTISVARETGVARVSLKNITGD